MRRQGSTIRRAEDHDASVATPAVAYVRMSTDHQKYSTENQLDVIRRYASARGLEIVIECVFKRHPGPDAPFRQYRADQRRAIRGRTIPVTLARTVADRRSRQGLVLDRRSRQGRPGRHWLDTLIGCWYHNLERR
ncbi:recombinase family protein [Rhodoplanes sp. SY1]|uniref:recombinase family protein n=1 Tax=Rhodoplanes sp. SY1 TaxID=3166646 RepID=UPI0038B43EB2